MEIRIVDPIYESANRVRGMGRSHGLRSSDVLLSLRALLVEERTLPSSVLLGKRTRSEHASWMS